MTNLIDIILIDDHKLFREGVRRILEFEPDFNVVAEGDDGSYSLDLVKEHRPDVVLMDINMESVNGIEATAALLRHYPETRVVILSIHDDESYVTHALQSGAQGYLLKEMDADALVQAIRIVSEGGSYLHPRVTHNLVKEYRRLAQESGTSGSVSKPGYLKPIHILTKRECEVLQLLAEGKSNKGVSKTLYISEKTVKNHVSNILQKINVTDRTQAVVEAIKKGWVDVI